MWKPGFLKSSVIYKYIETEKLCGRRISIMISKEMCSVNKRLR